TVLAPHLTVVTPNARELAFMTALPVRDVAEAEVAGRALAAQLGTAVLVKGGHLGGTESIDILIDRHGVTLERLRAPRMQEGEHVHGTGCALSSALAAHLAHGRDLVEASRLAKQFVGARIAHPIHPGRGAAAVV